MINKLKRIKCSANFSYFFNYVNKDYLLLINNESVSIFSILKNEIISSYNLPKSLNVKKFIIVACDFSYSSLTLVISCTNMNIYTIKITDLVENCILVNELSYSDKKSIKQIDIGISYRITTSLRIFNANKQEFLIMVDSTNDIKKYNLSKESIVPLCSNNNTNKYNDNSDSYDNTPKNLLTWYNKIISIEFINDELLLANTDYNVIPIQLNKPIPKYSIINRDINNRNKASSGVFLLKDYHNDILLNMNKNNHVNSHFKDRNSENNKHNQNLINNDLKSNENGNFSIITKFKTNIFMKYFNDTLFVVEVDWENILKQMSNPIVKKRFKN